MKAIIYDAVGNVTLFTGTEEFIKLQSINKTMEVVADDYKLPANAVMIDGEVKSSVSIRTPIIKHNQIDNKIQQLHIDDVDTWCDNNLKTLDDVKAVIRDLMKTQARQPISTSK